MENEEKKEEGKSCGGKSGCGIKCCCCVCKIAKAVALLAIGFFVGRHCGLYCADHRTEKVEVTRTVEAPAPAAPAKPAKK